MSQASSSSALGVVAGPPAEAKPRLAAKPEVEARIPEFAELGGAAAPADAAGSLDHLLDVSCTVTAELGRLKMSIGEVLKLNGGSILELDRLVSEPVDIMVQGVLLAHGEVVVVNNHFAVRIKEIVDVKKR
jgi:flagellar motor switch protein FliN/FliY